MINHELVLARNAGKTKVGHDKWAAFDARRCEAIQAWNKELLAEIKVRPIGSGERHDCLEVACAFGILTALFELSGWGNASWVREQLRTSTWSGMTRKEAKILHLEWARRTNEK